MQIVIKIIGAAIIAIAILFELKPDLCKRLLEFFKKGKNLYIAGLIRLILAVVFLLAARECHIKWLIAAFGVLFLISGFLIYTMPLEKLKSILQWQQRQSDVILRIMLSIPMVIGALIIYAA